MARRFIRVLLLLASVTCGLHAQAATSAPVGPAAPISITLGQSVVSLYGPWKFQVGDSPADAGQPLWAKPGFDDTTWETVDLTPKSEVSPFKAEPGYVAGWGTRGHASYAGYGWYRIRIRVQGQPGKKLALAGPAIFDDAYQVFVDGTLLGGSGRFAGKHPKFFYSQPMVFSLPKATDATQVIAFRFWMSPISLLQPDAGGFHLAPLVGTTDAIAAAYQLRWLDLVRENVVWALTAIVYSLLAVLAFSLFVMNRTDWVYFWMGLQFLLMGLGGWETALASWSQTISVPVEVWVCQVFVIPLLRFVWIMLLRAWFRQDRPAWLPWATGLLAAVQAVSYAGTFSLLSPLIPITAAPAFYVVSQIIPLGFLLVLCWLIYHGIRRFGVEGWLLLPAAALAWGDWLAARLTFLHLPRQFSPFGISLNMSQIVGFLVALALCALLVRRWVHSAQQQQRMTLELKQAQEVQQVLIPEAVPDMPGFSIQAVYQPAGEVGGDFFQILAARQGGVLLCIGDVSGKGMPAAMTVSLLVGTLRTLAHYTQSPGEILAAMNQRMLGRSRGGFTTCLVLLAAADGTVTVANAGHISPYLNGVEVTLENGLPLGLVGESTYTETTFVQRDNDQITLVTDGVVEARAESGELFGFDRTSAIARQSAASIAAAAKDFGQDDDITVLTLTRVAVGAQSSVATPSAVVLSPSIA